MKAPILAAALLAGCATMTAGGPDAVEELARAETAFAAASVRTDMRAAFLANFAPDGVMVSGGWVNAHALLEPRQAPPIVLDWRPWHVEVAASGELGLSTGPWVREPRGGGAIAHGQFVSIWRRQADGHFKVEADFGVAHPSPWAEQAGIDYVLTPPSTVRGSMTLEAAETAFVAASLRGGPRAAYQAYASDRILLYREGYTPLQGHGAALASAAPPEAPTVWLADRVAVSRSDEFGYVRGNYADAAQPDRVRGQFLRVWRREAGSWRIVLDAVNSPG
jgi:ketosteroid isomerase-like protein